MPYDGKQKLTQNTAHLDDPFARGSKALSNARGARTELKQTEKPAVGEEGVSSHPQLRIK